MKNVTKVVKSVKYNAPEGSEVKTISYEDKPDVEKVAIFRTYQVIWYVLGIIETLLLVRFLFRLFAASPGSPIVRFIYSFSSGLIAPFKGIFPTVAIENASVFEWTSLVAMIGYVIIAYGLIYLFQLVKPVDENEVENVVDSV